MSTITVGTWGCHTEGFIASLALKVQSHAVSSNDFLKAYQQAKRKRKKKLFGQGLWISFRHSRFQNNGEHGIYTYGAYVLSFALCEPPAF